MCSQTQPKMFGGAQPLGSGGNFSAPTVYQSNAQPTANVGSTPPPTPPQPPTAGPSTAPNPAQSAQPSIPGMQQWWQRWASMGGPRGVLPSMNPGGSSPKFPG